MIPLHILFERVNPRTPGKINAPMFAYQCLYGSLPPNGLSGRGASHEEVIWHGIGVDKAIPIKALNDLDSIPEIELRSSCQGSDKDRPTFLIFRLKSHDVDQSLKLAKLLSKYDDMNSCSGIGNEGLPRIIVTSKLWYDMDQIKFKKWWLNIAPRIKKCLRDI